EEVVGEEADVRGDGGRRDRVEARLRLDDERRTEQQRHQHAADRSTSRYLPLDGSPDRGVRRPLAAERPAHLPGRGRRRGPGRADDLARLLRTAMQEVDFRGLTSPLQRGFYSRRLLQAAGGTKAEQEMQAFLARLKDAGLDPRSLDLISKRVAATLKALEEAA